MGAIQENLRTVREIHPEENKTQMRVLEQAEFTHGYPLALQLLQRCPRTLLKRAIINRVAPITADHKTPRTLTVKNVEMAVPRTVKAEGNLPVRIGLAMGMVELHHHRGNLSFQRRGNNRFQKNH
jgi:hypothetical protein